MNILLVGTGTVTGAGAGTGTGTSIGTGVGLDPVLLSLAQHFSQCFLRFTCPGSTSCLQTREVSDLEPSHCPQGGSQDAWSPGSGAPRGSPWLAGHSGLGSWARGPRNLR